MGANIAGYVDGERRELYMSNGAYTVLHEVLALAASRLATTDDQRYWALWIASHDMSVTGHGAADYEIGEMPWSPDELEAERGFFLATIDGAIARVDWNLLGYDPPRVAEDLAVLRSMVVALRPEDVAQRGESFDPPAAYTTCERDGVVLHDLGCIVCNNAPLG